MSQQFPLPDKDYKALIRCYTYNQVNYIEDALKGFISQKTNFPFIALIVDDCSTDGTQSVIRKYEKLHPEIVKGIYLQENHYSQKKSKVPYVAPWRERCIYEAVCEGDDYWTDPNKLQRQVDFMEHHPEFSISAENGLTLFTDTNVAKPFSSLPESELTIEDLLIKRRFPTASVLYRKKDRLEIEKIKIYKCDTITWALLSQLGKVHYNPIISSVYRRGPGVTENNKIKWAYTSEHINKIINCYFKPSSKVKSARQQTLYFDFKSGWKRAKEIGDKKNARKLFLKMIFKSPIFFLKDILKSKGRKKILNLRTYFWNIFFNLNIPGKLNATNNTSNKLIVSLTSYPPRFKTLHLCLKSLFRQSQKPDKIILNLSSDIALENIPKKILRLQKYGLEIYRECKDIKPHKKYLYTMTRFPNAVVVTADDDVLYPYHWLKSLYKSYLEHPNCISARRVHKIQRNLNGEATPYASWIHECTSVTEPSADLLAVGVGGVLYPPHLFNLNADYFNMELIKKYCLNADDIWLKFIELKEKVSVRFVPNKLPHPYKILGDSLKTSALCNENQKLNKNDLFIQNCESFFQLKL